MMIEITYTPQSFELKLQGHAGYAPKGKDIVCSAVSILFYTAIEALQKHDGIWLDSLILEAKGGNGYIKCAPKHEYTEKTRCVFDTVLSGFELLEKNYKNFIVLGINPSH